MKIRVESTWDGHAEKWTLFLPGGGRETVPNPHGSVWGRAESRYALDLLENVYGYNRRSIRFNVV